MPLPGDTGGGGVGGGTTSSFCPPSPADMEQQINNALSRISALEDAVASLATQDVNAVQMSDITPSVGWVYDVTYMGIPGWTQTEAGTLIPPIGFNISMLNLFPNGQSTSGLPSGGNFSWAQVSVLATANAITSIAEYVDADNIVSTDGSSKITITSAGLYVFSMLDQLSISHTAAAYGILSVFDNAFGLPGSSTVCEGGQVITGATSGTKSATLGSSTVTTIPAGSYDLKVQAVASGGTWNHLAVVSILKLS